MPTKKDMRQEMHWVSDDGYTHLDIVRITGDELTWDATLHFFPRTGLTGTYNDFDKMLEDILPFMFGADLSLNEGRTLMSQILAMR